MNVALPDLPPRNTVELQLELTPAKRGMLQLEALRFFWPDPLGIFRASLRVARLQSIPILPRRYWLPPVRLPGTTKYQRGGVALASSVGESEEFMALRDHRPGDSVRHIHWKSWARLGKPIVKEFEDEFFVRHALILDTFGGPEAAERFEEAVSVAASFACTLPEQDSLLDLLFIGPQAYCFTIGRGIAHPEQALELLAAVSLTHKAGMPELRELVLRHVGVVSGAICVFLEWDETRQRLVNELLMLGIPVKVLVITASDAPALGCGPLGRDPENFHQLRCGGIAEELMRL